MRAILLETSVARFCARCCLLEQGSSGFAGDSVILKIRSLMRGASFIALLVGLTFSSSKIWNASGSSRASRRAWADFLEAFTPPGTMVGDRFRYIRNTMRPIVPSCIRVAWRGANFVEARRALRKSTVPMIARWPSLSLSCSLARFFIYIYIYIYIYIAFNNINRTDEYIKRRQISARNCKK